MPNVIRRLPLLYALATLLLVLVLLYWTRVVLMSVAVAVLPDLSIGPGRQPAPNVYGCQGRWR
jgi:hypothetical protein